MLFLILMLLNACKQNKLIYQSKKLAITKEIIVEDEAYNYIFKGIDEVSSYVKEITKDIQKSLCSKNIKAFGELVKKAKYIFPEQETTLVRLYNYTISYPFISRLSLKSCFESISISIKNIDMAIAIDSYEAIEEIKGDEDFGAEEYYAMLKEAIDRRSDSIIARIIIDQIDADNKDQFGIILKMIYDLNDEEFENRLIYDNDDLREKLTNISEEYMKVYYEFCPRIERQNTHTDVALIALQINRADMLDLLNSLDDSRIDYVKIVDNNIDLLVGCELETLTAFCKNMSNESIIVLIGAFISKGLDDRIDVLFSNCNFNDDIIVLIIDYLVKVDVLRENINLKNIFKKLYLYLHNLEEDKKTILISKFNNYRDYDNKPLMFTAIMRNTEALFYLGHLGCDFRVLEEFINTSELSEEAFINILEKFVSCKVEIDKKYFDLIIESARNKFTKPEDKKGFVDKISSFINKEGFTILTLATVFNKHLVKDLLDFGLDPNSEVGVLPPLVAAYDLGKNDMFKLLLEHNANVKVMHNEKGAPLIDCIFEKPDSEAAQILSSLGYKLMTSPFRKSAFSAFASSK